MLDKSVIKNIVWDVDSTMYKPTDEIHRIIRDTEIQTITAHTGWDREKAESEFYKIYKNDIPSGTAAAAKIAGISVADAAEEMDRYFDKSKFLKKDIRLVRVFMELKQYRHYILTNGTVEGAASVLRGVGLDREIFTDIVTSQKVGENKPSIKGFEYIMNSTSDTACAHVMVGDRIDVDIIPAKKMGWQTVLVWSRDPCNICDVALDTVYDLPGLLVN